MSIKKEYPRLELRGQLYRIIDYVPNRIRISTKTSDRSIAEQILAEHILNKQTTLINTNNKVAFFDDIALRFMQDKIRTRSKNTVKIYKSLLKNIFPFFSRKNMGVIKKIDFKNYEDYRRLNGAMDGLIRKEFDLLQAIFNYAQEYELIESNPFNSFHYQKNIEKYKIKTRFLKPEECSQLLENCNDDLKELVIVLLETGLRINEIMNILFTDIAIDRNTNIHYLVLRKELSKNKKERYIQLSKLAMEQINRRKIRFPNSLFIFTTSKGEPYKTLPKKALNNAMIKAGLKEKGDLFHLLRHTAGSLWLNGLNIDGSRRKPLRIEVVSEVLGHSDIRITKQIYAQFDNSNMMIEFLDK